jgi:antibiotic biosynthesis monooxygenase (ABM) superfamily enzyme
VLAFDIQAHLDAWHDSPERELGLAATIPLIEGAVRVKPVSGFGLWFRTTQQGPPRWRVAVVTWLGIFPSVYVLFWLTTDLLRSWPLFLRTALLTLAVVLLMTWVIAAADQALQALALRASRNPEIEARPQLTLIDLGALCGRQSSAVSDRRWLINSATCRFFAAVTTT